MRQNVDLSGHFRFTSAMADSFQDRFKSAIRAYAAGRGVKPQQAFYMLWMDTEINQRTIVGYTEGRSVPSIDRLVALCRAMDIDVADILTPDVQNDLARLAAMRHTQSTTSHDEALGLEEQEIQSGPQNGKRPRRGGDARPVRRKKDQG